MLRGLCILLSLIIILPNTVYAAYDNAISAKSYVVMDSLTERVIDSKNEMQNLPMASTTKIMTCFLACISDKLSQVITITDDMVNTVGTSLYLKPNDKIVLADLVKGAMLSSGNDAANAIAIALGGNVSSFVDMMNDKANELGMANTLFVTPSGLDEGEHHSTAYDMAILTSAALKNDYFKSVCKLKSAKIMVNDKERIIYNHNKLLSYSDNFLGVKTGYTQKAGRCLVSAYDYYGSTIICVTLNAPNDWQDHKNLIKKAKLKYNRYYADAYVPVDIVGANRNKLKCTYSYDLSALDNINIKIYYYPFVYAPVSVGDEVGIAVIYSEDLIIKIVSITASEGINSYG